MIQKLRPYFFTLCFFSCFASVSLWGQIQYCVDFESVDQGIYGQNTGYEPGDLIFSQHEVDVSLAEFVYLNGSTGFFDVNISDDINVNTDLVQGQFAIPNNANLVFDFAASNQQVSFVCFNFIDLGGEINIGVNGQNVMAFENFEDVPGEIAPGVTFEVTFFNTNLNGGTVCLSGNIENLTVGGQEFYLDNVCFFPISPIDCQITEVIVETHPCTPNGIFYVDIEVHALNPGNDGFTVRGNGTNYGTFSYNVPFITIGPLVGDGETPYEFVVIDNQNEDCRNFFDLGPIDCAGNNCVIDELEAFTLNCIDDHLYNIYVDFVPVNTLNTSFDLFVDNEFYGFYNYANDLPLIIEGYEIAPNSNGIVITVCDNDNPNCCRTMEVDIIPCEQDGCIGFEYTQESLYGTPNGITPGEAFYTEQGVDFSLDSLYRNDDPPAYEYVVVRHASNDANFNFEAAVGRYLYNDGISTMMDFSDHPDEVHAVTMDFIHNKGLLNLSVNGQDLIIETGELENGTIDLGNGFSLEVIITETSNTFTQGVLTFISTEDPIETLLIGGTGLGFDNVCLNPACELGEMTIHAGDCTDDDTFMVSVDFEYQHTVSDSFRLRINGELEGIFAYADLPLELGPYASPTDILEFTAIDLESEDCRTSGHLAPVNCNCPTFEFEILEGPICINANEYMLDIRLLTNGPLGDLFIVTNAAGQSIEMQYNNTGIYHLILGGGQNVEVITICDSDMQDCCIEVELHPNCATDCEFSNLVFETTACNNNGNFFIEVDFDFNHLNANFQLYVNQEVYEHFNLNDLPLTIGPFDGDGETTYVVGIQGSNVNQNCYVQETLGPVDCDTGVDCGIFDVIVEPYDCDGDHFLVDLAFESQNTGPLGYYVFVSGQIFGPFSYNEPFVTIGPLAGDGETFYNFTILDIADPACFGFYELGTYNCNQECEIFDLVVDAHDCDPNGTYSITIDFEYHNPGNNFFDVFNANGESLGFYSLADLPVTIDGFSGNGGAINFIQVCINDHPNCCSTTSFMAPDCTGDPCQITNVFAEAYDCENGTFLIDLVVSAENPGAHGYTVLGNGHIYGTFEYSAPFITLGPFEGDGETVYEFIVVDNDNSTCTDFTEIGPIDCPDCQLSELQYSVDCHSGPFFTLHLDFAHDNVQSDYFVLSIGNQVIDEFLYSALPLSLELPIELGQGEIITVCDNHLDNCCISADFFLPCCSIRDLVAEAHDCNDNGTFFVDLDFIHGNTGETFTLVYGPENGDLISEIYSYNDLPLTVGPFDGDNSTSWYFQATDESLFCQSSTTIDPVYCDDESCLEFESFDGSFFGPNTGYQVGDEIGEENGILMTYESFPGDECNCYVFVVDANTFPSFSGGAGHIIALFNSGIGFDFTTTNQTLTSITFDYYFAGTGVKVSVNGEAVVEAASPEDLPTDIATGVTLTVDAENGTMTFTGNVETLVLYGNGNFLLDNGCFETNTPEPVDVWPGDANTDNLASHFDLLNIGLAYDATGPNRNSNITEWTALGAEDWEESFADGVNYKHADCNGDGLVNEGDKAVILMNYGQQHGTPVDFTPLPATDLDPAIYLDAPDQVPNSLTFEIPVMLGTEAIPVDDIYGIAFRVEVDPELIDLASLTVEYPVSWMGEPGVNLISLDKKNVDEGILEIAMVRTDHNNVSGYGPIAVLRGIIDDIAGIHVTEIKTNDIKAISVAEQLIPLRKPMASMTINTNIDDPIGKIDLMRNLQVYPNPTSGLVQIAIKYQLPIEQVDIVDPAGRQVAPSVYNENTVSMESLPSGMYMLKVHLGGYIITKRVVKTTP
ncbi:MAG: hypothetical protein DHS20C18_49650 [Saprospiraceae bacterium]|nr:MAG: hypothetical protein DHS20C18_49650 [Saprospiraceae bacterium]